MALPPHSFAQKFIRWGILDRVWAMAYSGLQLVTSFLVLTALSVHEFGVYQLVLSAVAVTDVFLVGFFDEVFLTDITRHISDGEKPEAKRLFLELALLKIGVGVAVTLGLFFGADFVAAAYGRDIGSLVRIAGVVVALRSARSVAGMFLSAVVSLKAMGVQAVEELSRLVLVAGMFYFSALGVREVLLATVVASSVALIYVGIPFVRGYRSFLGGVAASRKSMFRRLLARYGPWVLLRAGVGKAATPMRPWLIAAFLNAEAVALYALASNLVTMIKNFLPQVSPSLLAWEVANPERLRYIFARSIKYSLFLGLAVAAGVFLFVPPLIGVILPKYLPAMPLFLLLALSIPVHGISRFESAVLTVLREQKVHAETIVISVIASVAILAAFLPLIGVLAVGVEVSGIALWRIWFFYRRITRKYPFLAVRLKSIVWFDGEDRVIFRRGFREVRSFFTRSG